VGTRDYRSRGRLPILSFFYPDTSAPLMRASQPRTGITRGGSTADQEFLAAACGGRRLSILDCRPRLNAVVNQFTGGGYERPATYPNCSFEFLGIPNIHRVRECYQQMVDSFQHQKEGGHVAWGALTLQLIQAAALAVERLRAGDATLVHCTDGWDRTAQLTGLVQVILDPFSRTIEGFRQVIQKEWCDFGHMFGRRCGHDRSHSSECAPIFAQFIDAVAQLVLVQPDAFQFSAELLGFVLFHAYSQLYGDFLANSCAQRVQLERPPSLWMCVRDPAVRERFTNQGFVTVEGPLTSVIPEYTLLPQIGANPMFGCTAGLLVVPEPPAMDPAWLGREPAPAITQESDSADLLLVERSPAERFSGEPVGGLPRPPSRTIPFEDEPPPPAEAPDRHANGPLRHRHRDGAPKRPASVVFH
jgi:hypothetical protein